MKKTMVFVLTVAMIFSLLPAAALAAETTVSDAAGLANAIADGSIDVIKLSADITNIQRMEISRAVTIDMNGFDISGNPSDWTAFKVVSGGNLILTNSNSTDTESRLLVGTGLVNECEYEGIRIKADTSTAMATISKNVSVETGCPVVILGNGALDSARLDVYGKLAVSAPVDANNAYAAIQGNGSAGYGGTVINIYGGAEIINVYDAAMYIPQAGLINISGGTITGKASAIALKSGTLNISDGVLTATGPATIPTAGYSNGVNASGCTIQLESNSDYAGGIIVNITGGAISSANGYALYEYIGKGTGSAVNKIDITGGTFQAARENFYLISEELTNSTPGTLNFAGATFTKGASTEVTAAVNPTYMIVIPSSVNFGTLLKNSGLIERDFDVEAKGVLIDSNASINVSVAGPFKMWDVNGTGSVPLAYVLKNATLPIPEAGGMFANFKGDHIEKGMISVNTVDITAAGSYQGTMVFTISYVPAPTTATP